MIKAKADAGDRTLWLFGLSRGNINRLMAGQPILIRGNDLGLEKPVDITIIFGETEEDMEIMLRREGMITEQTETHYDPKLPK